MPRKTALGFICVHLRVSAAGFGFKRPLQTQDGRRWTPMHADNAAHFDSAPERFDSGKIAADAADRSLVRKLRGIALTGRAAPDHVGGDEEAELPEQGAGCLARHTGKPR